jgi:prefoldin beta subunit
MAEEQDNQKLLQSAAVLQQQLQNIMAQKEAIGAQVLEIKKALDELEKSKESEVYKIAGPILIKSPRAGVLKELKDRDETLDLRFKTMEKEEKRIKLRIEEFREKLVKGMNEPVGG